MKKILLSAGTVMVTILKWIIKIVLELLKLVLELAKIILLLFSLVGIDVEDCPPPEGYKDYNEWLVGTKKKMQEIMTAKSPVKNSK